MQCARNGWLQLNVDAFSGPASLTDNELLKLDCHLIDDFRIGSRHVGAFPWIVRQAIKSVLTSWPRQLLRAYYRLRLSALL